MIRIYADLNCPFCYALNEWVCSEGLQEKIDWRLVEHSPQSSYNYHSASEIVELTEEVFTLRLRAPDVPIKLPKGRSSTHLASLLLCQARQQQPEFYEPLKQRIYRAFWAEDKNIEDPNTLQHLMMEIGTPPLELPVENNGLLKQWTQEWYEGPFDRRLPVVQYNVDNRILGLSPKGELLTYLRHGHTQEYDYLACTCSYQQRPQLIVVGCWQTFLQQMAELRDHFDVIYLENPEKLYTLFNSSISPDIILQVCPQIDPQSQSISEAILSVSLQHMCPFVFIGPVDDQLELELLQRGCNEVIPVNKPYKVLANRILLHSNYKKTLDDLFHKSLTDGLTQLDNRRSFENSLEREWSRASRSKQPLSLILLDIDHFKRYNDHYGHPSGDSCLREIADVLHALPIRAYDKVCRIGGEEFACILPSTPLDRAIAIAETIRQSVNARAIEHQKSPLKQVTCSIGVASTYFSPEHSVERLIKQADTALYSAKTAGRNCVHTHHSR